MIALVGLRSLIAFPIWPRALACLVWGWGEGLLCRICLSVRPAVELALVLDLMRPAELRKLFGVLNNFLSLLLRLNGFSLPAAMVPEFSCWPFLRPESRLECSVTGCAPLLVTSW